MKSGQTGEIPCKGIFLSIGHVPNTQPFATEIDTDENGYFLTTEGSMVRTSKPGIYVAGDCADHTYRQAVTAAAMGCQAAISAERWLAEQN